MAAWVALLVPAATLLIGCASSPAVPPVEPGRFPEAEVRIESGGPVHVVAVELSSPGWEAVVTDVEDEFRARAVFVTLRRPDPTIFYAQRTVTHRLATSVRTNENLRVYARVLDFVESRESDRAYQIAAEAEGKR